MIDERFYQRRAWFDPPLRHLKSGSVARHVARDYRYTCPCCGYPTLPARSCYDICIFCGWEDDGQDDGRADEVWGGPNGSDSLSGARERFARDPLWGPPLRQELQHILMQIFDLMIGEQNPRRMVRLCRLADLYERLLRAVSTQ